MNNRIKVNYSEIFLIFMFLLVEKICVLSRTHLFLKLHGVEGDMSTHWRRCYARNV